MKMPDQYTFLLDNKPCSLSITLMEIIKTGGAIHDLMLVNASQKWSMLNALITRYSNRLNAQAIKQLDGPIGYPCFLERWAGLRHNVLSVASPISNLGGTLLVAVSSDQEEIAQATLNEFGSMSIEYFYENIDIIKINDRSIGSELISFFDDDTLRKLYDAFKINHSSVGQFTFKIHMDNSEDCLELFFKDVKDYTKYMEDERDEELDFCMQTANIGGVEQSIIQTKDTSPHYQIDIVPELKNTNIIKWESMLDAVYGARTEIYLTRPRKETLIRCCRLDAMEGIGEAAFVSLILCSKGINIETMFPMSEGNVANNPYYVTDRS